MKNLIKKVIVFLIRKRLGLKKGQAFQFENQKSKVEYYMFVNSILLKVNEDGIAEYSHVSLNWLLDDNCVVHDATSLDKN